MSDSNERPNPMAPMTPPAEPPPKGGIPVTHDVHDEPAPNAQAGTIRQRMQGLIRDHHERAFRYAYHLTGSAVDAEDVVQQAFMIAHQSLDQLRDEAKAQGWLLAIVRTTFLKSIRRQRPKDAGSLELNVAEIPVEAVESAVDGEMLHQALSSLSDDNRLVLLMFYFEDASYREIAERLNLPIGTVMSRLSRAKRKLRAAILDRDASLADRTEANDG